YKEVPAVDGKIAFEYDVSFESADGSWELGRLYDTQGNPIIASAFENGMIRIGRNGQWTDVQPYVAEERYRIRIILDTDADVFDLYINGRHKLRNAALGATSDPMNRFGFA